LILIYFAFTKEQLFFAINGNNNSFLDYLFYLLTELGNTWTFIIVILISLFLPRRFTYMLLAGLAISSLLAQGLKHFVFDDAMRPLKYFQDSARVHHLVNSAFLYNHSFPSGHSVSVFTLVTLLVAVIPRRRYDLLLLFMACLTAYSRVYLGQHFFEDVVFGSVIGVFSGTIAIFIFRDDKKFMDPLIKWKWLV
jgi:membrane-associated phospholipid phosphatase